MTTPSTSPLTAPRRALVTGGATGIGLAICRTLAAQGIAVALADINIAAAQAKAQELGPQHVALEVDLTDLASAAALPRRAADALGGLDIIINNAGITDTSGKRIGEIEPGVFDRLVAVNLGSVEVICKAGQSVLGQGGVTVNLASGAAYRALPLRGAYSATKAGVVALTEAMDAQARPLGQRVSAVAPGYVRTELVESLITNGRLDPVAAATTIPLGRLGTPEDIAAGVAFLVSDRGAVLAGSCLAVDGGTGAAGGAQVVPQSDDFQTTAEGPTIVIGDPEMAAPVADEMGRHGAVTSVAGLSDLTATNPCRAILDLGGLSVEGTANALARIRGLAASIEARAPGRGFSLVLTGRAEDAVGVSCLEMMARLLALEWGARGYRVNAVAWSGSRIQGLAELASWLSSDAAAYVTGQVIRARPDS